MKIKVKYKIPIINKWDYQSRIYKNSPEIKWIGKVHEVISGHKTIANLPSGDEWCLMHKKSIQKQEKQNNFYSTL